MNSPGDQIGLELFAETLAFRDSRIVRLNVSFCRNETALALPDLRRIRIHDLRHTCATLRISKGDSIANVSNQFGHHSVKLSMDVYYHWMPGTRKDEVDALDDIYTFQYNKTEEEG